MGYNIFMDAIDKYYSVSLLFDDDLSKVVIALKDEGIKSRPSRIMRDITELCVYKYSKQFDKILHKYSGGKLC